MRFYTMLTMAISSVLALALLSGCDQKGDTEKEMPGETKAAVAEEAEAGSTMMKDASENMDAMAEGAVEKMDSMAEGAAEKMDSMAEGAAEKMDAMAEGAAEKIDTMVDGAKEKMGMVEGEAEIMTEKKDDASK